MPRSKVQRNGNKYKYSKQEIVWAKTAGYPWWPASITCLPSKNRCFYKVDFIGDRSYALLSEQKLAPYIDLRNDHFALKKADKHFLNAVTIAAKKYDEWLVKQMASMKSKGSVECKTSQQKQQLNQQIQLPQIPENIQQLSSLDQQLYLCSDNLSPIPEKNSQHLLKQQKNINLSQQNRIEQQAEPQAQPCHMHDIQRQPVDQQQRQRLIEELLAKYKLNSIPDLKQLRKAELEKSEKERKKLHWKKKLISKRKQNPKFSTIQNDLSSEVLLTRKIYRFLMAKLHSVQDCKSISLSLKEQIMREKIQKADCLKKLIEWIGMTDAQNIVSFEGQWINFFKENEREREKHSHLTMSDESEQISVK